MQSHASRKQYATGMVSTDGSSLLNALIIDRRDRLADLQDDALAYMLGASVDDAELREVFGDFMVPPSTSD